MDIPQSSEVLIRLGFFIGLFATLSAFEALFPRRSRRVSRGRRWPSNIGVSVLNQVFVRLLLPVSAIEMAIRAEQNQWGLFSQLAFVPWVEVLAAVLILDLAIYLQHILYHKIPLLWRFHRMHHADVEFDVTTGIRFHPLSVLLSGCIKIGVVFAIGASPIAVLIFEVLLNATSLFNHSNLTIPRNADRILRRFIVTPDMHRVHHSSNPTETNRNFGFNFPWWDRMFRTYLAQPSLGHTEMIVGLHQFRQEREYRLDRMLWQPFR